MQSRRLDTREAEIDRATMRMRTSARRSIRMHTHDAVPISTARILQEVPVTPPPGSGDAGDTLRSQSVAPSALKGRVVYEFQDDAWLNDARPVAQPQSSPRVEKSTEQVHHSSSPGKGYIGRGHRLWGAVLRLSERIWQELCEKFDTPSNDTGGGAMNRVPTRGEFVPARTSATLDFVRKRFLSLVRQDVVLASQMHTLTEVEQVLNSVVDEVLGYGPLEVLMKDESVAEIVVIGPRMIYVERKGEVQETRCTFEDERHLLRIIETMLRQAGQKMKLQRPTIGVCLPDGSFVDIVLPPHAVKGPTMTIRKRPRRPLTIADLVAGDVLTQEMADFLAACIVGRLTIAICGGRGAGKTTLLNAVCGCIPAERWTVTVEDVPELQLSQRQAVSLVAQGGGFSEAQQVTTRDLLKHALYLRPQHLIVGECCDEETVELFGAIGAGYDGVLMTVSATSVRDCLRRLEMMIRSEEVEMPATMIRERIASCLDVIVSISRMRDGSYKVRNIAEVVGVEADVIRVQSIFHYRDEGVDERTGKVKGTFRRSGFCPTFLAKLEAREIVLPKEMFMLHSITTKDSDIKTV